MRFRVKPARTSLYRNSSPRRALNWARMRRANIIKTGERSYCIIAEWSDMDALAAAFRNDALDSFRDSLKIWVAGLA